MRLHLHRYGPWKYLGVFGFTRYQEKICEVCGKRKQKAIGWDAQ